MSVYDSLIKSIRNLFYDACRRTRPVEVDQSQVEGARDCSPNQARLVDGKLDVATLLGALTSEEREILYLNCVERFTAEEIGNITGKVRGTILSQLSRAKEKIRRQKNAEPFSEEAV